jgi:hypothetical protein
MSSPPGTGINASLNQRRVRDPDLIGCPINRVIGRVNVVS